MTTIEEERKWLYQNFNMGTELDIAGGFIFDGIKKIHEMSSFANNYETFSALYNIAVGIERLQKIVIVLWGLDDIDDYTKFGGSLKTHKHSSLRDRINTELSKNGKQLKFTKDENDIIELVQKFYNKARYARYNFANRWDEELVLLRNLLEKKNLLDKCAQDFNDDVLYITKAAKDFFGKSIGSIARKYYQIIRDGSYKNGTYTYEMEYGSKAQKIFLKNPDEPVSLISDQEIESQVLKEIFLYFRNSKIKDPFLSFLDEIRPLELDPAELPCYLEDIFNCKVSQDLIDTVQFLYEEMDENELKERNEVLSLVGDSHVEFEAKYTIESFEKIKEIYETGDIKSDDIALLKDNIDYIGEDEFLEIIGAIISECSNLLEKRINLDEFRCKVDSILQEFEFDINQYLSIYKVQ